MRTFWVLWGMRIRRDAVQLPLWILGNAAMALVAVGGVAQAFGGPQERLGLLATVAANPVILLFRGLPSGAGGAQIIAFLILPFLVMIAALMSSFLAVRHTRAEEETGRAELVGATPAGRTTALAATIAHGTAANVLTAALVSFAFMFAGLPAAGSVTAGSAAGAAGLCFFAFSLLCAQLLATSRGANTAGVIGMLIAFLMCGIGNATGTPSRDLTRITSNWPAWLSPYGWAENTRPYADDDLRPLLLCIGGAIVFTVATLAIQSVRDLGAAPVPARRGPRRASWALRGPISLAWHLNRGAVVTWVIGGMVAGALSTALSSAVGTMTTSDPALATMLTSLTHGGSLRQGTAVIFFTLIGVLASCCAVQVMTRLRQEEAHGLVEPQWSGTVSRRGLLGAYLVVGAIGVAATLLGGVAGAYAGMAKAGGDPDVIRALWVVTGGQAIAAAVFLAVGALLFTLLPRIAVLASWLLVMLSMILGFFGPIFGLPSWTSQFAPVAIAPTMTAKGVDLQSLWGLVTVIIVTAGAALVSVRRRPLVPRS